MSSASKSRSRISKTGEAVRQERSHGEPACTSGGPAPTPLDLRGVLSAALSERWLTVVARTEKARSKPTEKAVHDLRVAIRRMLALLDMVKTIVPKSGGGKIRTELKTHLKALSVLRDTQVQIQYVRRLAPDFEILSGFLAGLLEREAAQMKRAAKGIEHLDTDSLGRYFIGLKTKTDNFLSASQMGDASLSTLKGMLAKLYVKMVVLRNEIHTGSERPKDGASRHSRIQKIHELRLLFKRFRYSVEILQPMFPRISSAVLRKMSIYQSTMGSIQDTEVLISAIASHAKLSRKKEMKKNIDQPDAFGPLHDLLTFKLDEEVDGFLPAIDQLDEFWQRLN